LLSDTSLPSPAAMARPSARVGIAMLAAAVTILGILLVNPSSIANFAYYFLLWNCVVLLLNREDSGNFAFAFVVNSAFIAIYVFIQSTTYPDTYGTTSWHSVSWADDSYFFTLTADSFPPDLLARPFYWEYQHTFSNLIRLVTPLRIEHPLDVLFFQSGTAAMLSTFTSRLAWQWSGDRKLSNTVFVFALVCPFLMMNGGVILIRDTFAAALLVYSLCCLNERRFVLAAVAVAWQLALRPGTAVLLMPAYLILYWPEVLAFVRRHPVLVATGSTVFVLACVQLTSFAIEFLESRYGVLKIGFLGRELIADLTADPDANALFLRIQEMPFVVKLFLNGAYIFLYPFLTLRTVLDADYFDVRNFLLSIGIPIYAFWLNSWFFGGTVSAGEGLKRRRAIVVTIVVVLVLVGIYSLQTRHKTIIYPLYYLIIAYGFLHATPSARRVGYILSGALVLLQLAATLR
jgi:hypothetical protein